jgi:thiol-disulfide isomerase/thioredoxin
MNDLKGKVVLVDVWATWCGPCRAEIPHLKKLEEELKDKNIEFVSISVDEEKDRSKWKNMIEKEQLGGTQLFASGWSEIAKYYNITGIPRFMVFDQQGKIVSVNSPRPSQPELKQLLETTLEEK